MKTPHRCGDPKNWIDRAPAAGQIKTYCAGCGRFIGQRPAETKRTKQGLSNGQDETKAA